MKYVESLAGTGTKYVEAELTLTGIPEEIKLGGKAFPVEGDGISISVPVRIRPSYSPAVHVQSTELNVLDSDLQREYGAAFDVLLSPDSFESLDAIYHGEETTEPSKTVPQVKDVKARPSFAGTGRQYIPAIVRFVSNGVVISVGDSSTGTFYKGYVPAVLNGTGFGSEIAQYTVRQGNAVHVQVKTASVNRDYGFAGDFSAV